MSSVSPRCTVEVPEKQSVRKLKEWLTNFGDQNRHHFEKNQLRAPLGKVGYRIYSIEKRLSASVSFESASTTNDGSSSFSPIEADPHSACARKNGFSSSWARNFPDGGIERVPSDELRSASFHPESANQLMPIATNGAHTGPHDVLLWHPNARKAEEVTRDIDEESEYDEASDDDGLDGVSIHTGWYTDPGTDALSPSARASSLSTSSRMRMVPKVPLPPRSSKDDMALMAQSRPTSCRIHPKNFFCVIPQKESRHELHAMDSSSGVRDEADVERTNNDLPVPSAFSDRVASMVPNQTTNDLFPSTWSQTSDLSTLSIRPVGILDARLSSIFAEETDKLNHQAILNARYGAWHQSGSSIDSILSDSRDLHEIPIREGKFLPPTGASRPAPKKNAVESRKKELERKWAENRPPSHVKKVTWHVSNKGGGYKKKVYLDCK